jgi:outer membrane protein assembly factor BamE (lipoprotein component of BamABCDE complex)
MKRSLRIALALLASLCTSVSFAAPTGFVTQEQAMQVQAGQTEDQVIQMLGKPVSQPKWHNGTSSLVYNTISNEYDALLYVDIAPQTGKVITTSVVPESTD